jgi:hypothetical protein
LGAAGNARLGSWAEDTRPQDKTAQNSGEPGSARRGPAVVVSPPIACRRTNPGVAHVVLWECPERVAEDAAAFLTSLG